MLTADTYTSLHVLADVAVRTVFHETLCRYETLCPTSREHMQTGMSAVSLVSVDVH